jgi:mannose/fructose/N-acetylgalactosamine-specific phosphotransferase system component IIB
MSIELIRVDHRLVHGQVTMGWTRAVGADVIVVVNDRAAGNAFEANLMQMAVPAGVRLEVLSLDQGIAAAEAGSWPDGRVLLLVSNPVDLLKLLNAGLEAKTVNIGGVRSEGASIKLTKEVHATEDEVEAWKAMNDRGLELSVQWLPSQRRKALNDAVAKR